MLNCGGSRTALLLRRIRVNGEPLEVVVRNIDARLKQVEQYLPSLPTRVDLQAAIAPLATRAEMQTAIAALPTRADVDAIIAVAIAPLASRAELQAAIAPLATRAELQAAIAPLATRDALRGIFATTTGSSSNIWWRCPSASTRWRDADARRALPSLHGVVVAPSGAFSRASSLRLSSALPPCASSATVPVLLQVVERLPTWWGAPASPDRLFVSRARAAVAGASKTTLDCEIPCA
jgi:hypothetical protein